RECACATRTRHEPAIGSTRCWDRYPPARTRADSSLGSGLESTAPAPACELASTFFSNHLLENLFVQRQVGDEALQPRILLAHLPQLAHLGDAQAAVLLLPEVERRLGDAGLATDIRDRRAGLGEAQGVGDLLFGVPRFFIASPSPSRGEQKRPYSSFQSSR